MPPRKDTTDARKARLAKALKANLAKRKAQIKDRKAPNPAKKD